MDYSFITNNLAGLLIVTALMVIISKKATTSAILYAVQSVVLVLIFFSLAELINAHELYSWGFAAILTKVILVPLIMYRALGGISDPKADGMVIPSSVVVILCITLMLLCFFVAKSVNIPCVQSFGLEPILAVSLGLFMIGVLCIIVQRNILKQIFGYCLMENGAHLTLALLANKAPHLVEIGISTDAIFAVLVMVYMVRCIYSKIHTLSVQDLTELKG